jgi:hypothetical protein
MRRAQYLVPLLVALFGTLAFALSSCGGGSSGGGDSSGPPSIFAELDSFPPGAAPPGFTTSASVAVFDSDGNSITNASVTINAVALAYNAANEDYEGNLTVAPGSGVALSVHVNGTTYSASATQFTSYPTISAPAPSATWDSHVSNVFSWSGGGPTANAFYVLGALNAADPNGPLQWSDSNSGLGSASIGVNSLSIDPFRIPAGNRLLIIGIAGEAPIPNAAPFSSLVVQGFNYVPITVTGFPVTVRSSPAPTGMQAVTWSGSQFVAVGGDPTVSGTIMTSADGATWTLRNSGTTAGLQGITWSGSQFVAVGGGAVAGVTPATILSSPDGILWTARTSNVVGNLEGVAWSGSLFVAVGSTGGTGTPASIVTSPDGTTWTPLASVTTNNIASVTWSGSQFVAVGANGLILTSPDGKTWSSQNSGVGSTLSGIAWSPSLSLFVAVGSAGISDTILTSPDGVTWTARSSGTIALPQAVAWSSASSLFVAVGGTGGLGSILTSPDGVNWTQQASGSYNPLVGIASSGTSLVIVEGAGNGGPGLILTSP